MDIDLTPHAPFLGFRKEAFEWFDGITANNTKDWFLEHKSLYEMDVRDPLLRLLADAAAELGGSSKVFRQNRDVRFSKDKSPYKTNTYGVVSLEGAGTFGLYVSINSQGVTAGTGLYDMAKDQLERLRLAIMDPQSGPEFESLVADTEATGIGLSGAALATAPRGYPKDHPRIALLRLKQILLMKELPRSKAIHETASLDHALQVWRDVQLIVSWLGEHVGPSTLPQRPGPAERRRS